QNLEKSSINNKEISEHKNILTADLSKEESLNISNLIISENGNKSPLSDKNPESCKSNDACDFGYCSMDKVACVSPISDSDNASQVSKSHSEQSAPESPVAISPGLEQERILEEKPLAGRTPELQSLANENTFQTQPSVGAPLKYDQERILDEKALAGQTPELQSLANEDTFQTQPSVGAPLKDAGLEREISLHSSGNITGTGVSQLAAESTEAPVVKNGSPVVCTPASICVMASNPVTTVTTLQFEDPKSENSNFKDARIRRASKTPPPSPVDETGGGNFNLLGVIFKLKHPR
ncbi:hypothetical protein AVEN_243918-1, partial [Araneus ventricosus]